MASLVDVFRIQGFTSIKELRCLRDIASSMRPDALVVEVGSWKGRSTGAIALPHINLVCVDTFRGMPNNVTARIARREDIFRTFLSNMKRLSVYPTILKMDSIKAATLFQDASIDWLFVDSDHHNFAAEFYSWLRKVKPGGMASGHDFSIWWPAIPRTLRASGYKISVIPGTTIWYLKQREGYRAASNTYAVNTN